MTAPSHGERRRHRTEAAPASATLPETRALAIVLLVAGGLLALAGGQSLYAALARVRADNVMARVLAAKSTAAEDLDELVRSRRAAVREGGDASAFGDLALARLLQARRLPATAVERNAALDETIVLVRTALAREPASSVLWLRLAEAQLLRDGLGATPLAALSRSIATAPYQQDLVIGRLDFGLILEPFFDGTTRPQVAEQVRLMAGWMPQRLAEIARRRRVLAFVRAALGADPVLLERFDLAYAGLR
jgi:hypothetical protein